FRNIDLIQRFDTDTRPASDVERRQRIGIGPHNIVYFDPERRVKYLEDVGNVALSYLHHLFLGDGYGIPGIRVPTDVPKTGHNNVFYLRLLGSENDTSHLSRCFDLYGYISNERHGDYRIFRDIS